VGVTVGAGKSGFAQTEYGEKTSDDLGEWGWSGVNLGAGVGPFSVGASLPGGVEAGVGGGVDIDVSTGAEKFWFDSCGYEYITGPEPALSLKMGMCVHKEVDITNPLK
jgi:hypothetical protein